MATSTPRRASLMLPVLLALALVLAVPGVADAQDAEVVPLARTHAHNDYEHPRPLFDALDEGYMSVEADIWLVDGELLVAHDLEDVEPGRTLESLYLDPLRERVRANQGSVYPGHDEYLTLLIDVKSEAESTYRELHTVLRRYQDILTRFGPDGVKERAVTAVISGNRARELMESQRIRYAAYDGRLDDLGSGAPASFMPLISDNWTNHFTWDGQGDMPEEERALLSEIVETAHADNQRIRFWATPDEPSPEREAIWQELLDAGVDFLNTDHLTDLAEFLRSNDPNPSEPHVTWPEFRRVGPP